MKVNIDLIKEELITDQITPTNKFINGKRIYQKLLETTMSGTGQTTKTVGLTGLNYTPINFVVLLDIGTAIFQGNTPRGNGTTVQNTQLYSYWNYVADAFLVISNGFDRTGTNVKIIVEFTYN